MDDFSTLAQRQAAKLQEAQIQRAAAEAEQEQQQRLESAWARAFQFDADGFRGLARELDAHGLAAYLTPIAESRRVALDRGVIFADAELAVIALLRAAADGDEAELAGGLVRAPELWPDTLGIALDNLREYVTVRQRNGGAPWPSEPEPTPKAVVEPKHVAEPAAREPEPEPTGTSPSPVALQAHWLAQAGHAQGDIAEMLKVKQGTVSKWLAKVRAWVAAGNAIPAIPQKTPLDSKPVAMDPTKIDLGPRGDQRPEHIRQKMAKISGHGWDEKE